MKQNILILLSFAFLLTLISCSSNNNTQQLADTVAEPIASTSRSAGERQEEDVDFLLARKWHNKSGKIYLDIRIDGTFEGRFNNEDLISGQWKISDDKKTLSLTEGMMNEGKGGSFSATYTIVDMTYNNMKVLDQDGTELTLMSSEE